VQGISCITTIYAKSQDALGLNGGAIAVLAVECLMETPQKGTLIRRQTITEKYIPFGNYLIALRTCTSYSVKLVDSYERRLGIIREAAVVAYLYVLFRYVNGL
jgi:hypothetical protein